MSDSIESQLGTEPSDVREEAAYTPPNPALMTRKPGIKVYAGIGSRETPKEILDLMEKIGEKMAREGWYLRTGNATGADQAFARGANKVDPKRIILYLPWPTFEREAIVQGNTVVEGPSMEAQSWMEKLVDRQASTGWGRHWKDLPQGVQKLFARDLHQVYGAKLDWPVDLVICWTPGGTERGGTAVAVRAARMREDIQVINLGSGNHWEIE